MKLHTIIMVAVLASATMFAQTTASQSGSTPDAHSQHHPAPAASAQAGTGQASGPKAQGGMSGHMAAMQADMQNMRSQVERMRTDAEKVKDADTRAALLQNVALWQQFLDRMQSHMQMMGEGMMGMHGMMGHGGDHGCGESSASGGCPMMQGQTPPAKTTPPPKPQ